MGQILSLYFFKSQNVSVVIFAREMEPPTCQVIYSSKQGLGQLETPYMYVRSASPQQPGAKLKNMKRQ